MARSRMSFRKVAVVAGLTLMILTPGDVGAFNDAIGPPWCKETVGVAMHESCLFVTPSQTLLEHAAWTAVNEWNDTGSEFKFQFEGFTDRTDTGEPIPISCRNPNTDPFFQDNPGKSAYADVDAGLTSCFPFVRPNACKIVVDRTRPWRFDVSMYRGVVSGQNFVNILAHELGHCAHFDHNSDEPFSIMQARSSSTRDRHVTFDDALGFMKSYEVDEQSIQTSRATLAGGLLSFSETESLPDFTLGTPSASGNPDPINPAFDYVLAYTRGKFEFIPPFNIPVLVGFKVHVSLLRDGPGGTVVVESTQETPFFSTPMPPSVAVNDRGEIGIAWTGPDTQRLLRFAFSANNGQSWTEGDIPWGARVIGSPGLTYSLQKNRFVLSWISFTPPATTKYKIATMVSSTRRGLEWFNAPRVYDDEFTSHHGTPAIACSDASGECQAVFHQYGSSVGSIRVFQRALSFDENFTHLDSLNTFPNTGDASIGHLGIVRFPGGYIYTHVGEAGAVVAASTLRYRLKTGSETNPWPALQENRDITARQGVRVAYNHRTGDFRFFWIPD